MTQSYLRRNAGRKRRGGAWQWLIVGFFPGVLCGGAMAFALLLSGLFDGFSLGAANSTPIIQTQVVRVVYSPTPGAVQATNTPFIVTATPDPLSGGAETTGGAPQVPAGNDNIVLAATATHTPDLILRATQQALAQRGPSTTNTGDTGSFADEIEPDAPPPANLVPIDPNSPVPPQLQGLVTELVTVEGTTFQMGTTPIEVIEAVDFCTANGGACQPAYGEDSTPAFQAQLDTYQIERTEVTFRQYVAFLNYLASQGRSHLNGCGGFMCIQTVNEDPINGVIGFDAANYFANEAIGPYPVYAVTWYGANEYCNSIGRRLPTEAEWELAARGTAPNFIYPWGGTWDFARAQVRGSAGDPGPLPVGSFNNASPYGALDMAGNVAEWVQDWYDEDTYEGHFNSQQPVFDPQGPPVALQKVLRGGSWDARPFFARSVHRQSFFPAPETTTSDYGRWIGFRCAADVESDAGASLDPFDNTGDNITAALPNAQPTLPQPPN